MATCPVQVGLPVCRYHAALSMARALSHSTPKSVSVTTLVPMPSLHWTCSQHRIHVHGPALVRVSLAR